MTAAGPLPLDTARLRLRDFRDDDLAAVHAYARLPQVVEFMNWGPNTEAETRDFLRRAMAPVAASGRRKFELAVIERASGRLVGGCGLDATPARHARGFLGYCYHPDVWGRGYATEAAAALLGLGFDHLELHRIVATCDAGNHASARVLEKLGMQREGRLRHDVQIRGRWRDTLLFGILEDEWRAQETQPIPV